MTRSPPVFLLSARQQPRSSTRSRAALAHSPQDGATGALPENHCSGTVISSAHAVFVPRTPRAESPRFVEKEVLFPEALRRSSSWSFMSRLFR
jgi:hypothetical protein